MMFQINQETNLSYISNMIIIIIVIISQKACRRGLFALPSQVAAQLHTLMML